LYGFRLQQGQLNMVHWGNEDTVGFSIIAKNKTLFLFLDSEVGQKKEEWKGMDLSV
jgi:hypothetical protein